jgi:hypothetical protein
MINNPSPEGSGKEWNSDSLAIDNLSCRQLSALSTAFIGALRILNTEKKNGGCVGVAKGLHKLITHHIDLMESEDLPEAFKKNSEDVTAVSMMAFCLAAIASLEKVNPQHAGTLATTLMKSIIELTKSTGPIGPDDVVIVDTRITDKTQGDDLSAVELAIRLESSDLLEVFAEGTEIGQLIRKLVKEDEEPFGDEGIHGNN